MPKNLPRLAALLPSLLLGLATQAPAQLGEESVDDLLARILPAPAELEWQAIGWRQSLAQAVVEARAADKPILLWAMNGHPLGCV